MPLYEYQCDACAHRFEVIQKFSDPPIEVCPKCGSSVQKLLSSPAIQFKGSGWYITDYARAGKSDSANVGAGKSESAKNDKSDSAKSESSGSSTDASSTPKSDSGASAKSESKPTSPAKSD